MYRNPDDPTVASDTTAVPTLLSQMSETASTGCKTSTSRQVLSCDAQSVHRYSGGGWSLHSDATVGSKHIYTGSHAMISTADQLKFTQQL